MDKATSVNDHSQPETHMHRADTCHLLGTVLYAVCAVSILQETGCSVGVEDTQVFWTINACRGTNTTHLSERLNAEITLQSSLISVYTCVGTD